MHEVSSRERHLRRQAAAFGADRLLGNLHEERLAPFQVILDAGNLAALATAAAVVPTVVHIVGLDLLCLDEIGGVQKSAFLGPDVDECGLHPGKDGLDLPEIDVSYGPTEFWAIDQ